MRVRTGAGYGRARFGTVGAMRRGALMTLVVAASCSSGGDAVATPLDFSAPTVGGGELDMGDYADRDLAMWFWAPY